MWWIEPAFAGDLEVADTLPLTAPAAGVVAAGADWLVFGPDGAFLASGPTAIAAASVRAAGVVDLGADGDLDAVLCGPGGVWIVDPAGDLVLSDADCSALAVADDGWIAVLDGVATTWTLSAGVADAPEDPLAGSTWTDPIVAAGPGRWLVAERGAVTATEVAAAGTSSIAVGGPLSAAAWKDRWWLGFPGWVRGVALSSFAVTDPRRIASGDVDVDAADIVVLSSEGLVVAHEDGAVVSTFVVDALDVAVADGDCARVAVLVDAGMTLQILADDACGPSGDADGDGWEEPDDCDDTDPAIHPGATEDCDGVDQNCDGRPDDVALVLDAPTEVGEGDDFVIAASAGVCSAETPTITLYTGPSFVCAPQSVARYTCTALDDGTMSAEARAGDAVESASISALNLPPTWIGPTTFQPPGGDGFDISRMAEDPGGDPITFAPVDFPDAASLSPDGFLIIGDVGVDFLTIRLTDDLGAAADVTIGLDLPSFDTAGEPFEGPGLNLGCTSPSLGCDAPDPTCGDCGGLGCVMLPTLLTGLLLRRRL